MQLRHSAIVVEDLVRSLEFYQALGLTLDSRQMEEGDFIDSLVDLTDTRVETAKLTFPNGGKLELLQYHSHKDLKLANHLNVNKIGHSHIALTVTDVPRTAHNIVCSGGTMLNSPRVSPDGRVQAVYCRDPEGNILELVEELH